MESLTLHIPDPLTAIGSSGETIRPLTEGTPMMVTQLAPSNGSFSALDDPRTTVSEGIGTIWDAIVARGVTAIAGDDKQSTNTGDPKDQPGNGENGKDAAQSGLQKFVAENKSELMIGGALVGIAAVSYWLIKG